MSKQRQRKATFVSTAYMVLCRRAATYCLLNRSRQPDVLSALTTFLSRHGHLAVGAL